MLVGESRGQLLSTAFNPNLIIKYEKELRTWAQRSLQGDRVAVLLSFYHTPETLH